MLSFAAIDREIWLSNLMRYSRMVEADAGVEATGSEIQARTEEIAARADALSILTAQQILTLKAKQVSNLPAGIAPAFLLHPPRPGPGPLSPPSPPTPTRSFLRQRATTFVHVDS